MSTLKVLFIVTFATVCLGLAMATIIVPLTVETWERWVWLVGLLVATLGMGALFTLFLSISDRTLHRSSRR